MKRRECRGCTTDTRLRCKVAFCMHANRATIGSFMPSLARPQHQHFGPLMVHSSRALEVPSSSKDICMHKYVTALPRAITIHTQSHVSRSLAQHVGAGGWGDRRRVRIVLSSTRCSRDTYISSTRCSRGPKWLVLQRRTMLR